MTARALMRSRYSAYVLRLPSYLLDSWDPETRPAAIEGLDECKWLRLQVESWHAGEALDAEGLVTFSAWYTLQGRAHRLRECSRFRRRDDGWVYVDGTQLA